MRETERGSATLSEAETLPLNLVFDVLSDERRRYALYYLYDMPDGVATVSEITEYVLRLETDSPPSDDHRTQVLTTLQHVHLPKLADAGVLEHDIRSATVRYWGQPSLEEWLEHAQHKEGE
ncbi:DUF7344 domain-containing protein [Natronobiforma cellulositropha]|uniref:DUF7344 domain-containing protein n=1 Tax=Natronobiforma cellulositropha TaxID=1679076 RepID=UPI0021D58817|nr:hypothetical protein [Natronobiforma cellulositropha]